MPHTATWPYTETWLASKPEGQVKLKAELGLPLNTWVSFCSGLPLKDHTRLLGDPLLYTVPTHTLAPTLGQGKGRKGQYLIGVEGLEAGLGRAVEGAGDIESVV